MGRRTPTRASPLDSDVVAADLNRPRHLRRSLGRALAIGIVLFGLLLPRAFVYCQTEDGHAAIEALAAGCCGVSGPQERCFPKLPEAGSHGPAEENGIGSEACRDVLVDPPSSLPLGERLLPVPVAAMRPFDPLGTAPPLPGPAVSRGRDTVRPAAHELLLTTILRV